jgi:hypothetical protein
MNPSIPPPIPRKKQTIKVVIFVSLVCFFVFVLCPIVVAAIMGVSMLSWLKQAGEIHYRSSTDKFHVTVLELKSKPDYFMERVRIRCEGDMEASIWVTDLKQAGIFQATDTTGAVFYHEGHPHKAGSSVPVHADGKFSTCDILFSVSTTSNNTAWHDEVAGGTLDTTFPVPLAVGEVQTNWPSSYERGSDIPLASLGDYKILLSAK